MNLLIAIKGCERDAQNGFHEAMRETWVKDVRGADVRFFVGAGSHPLKDDEVRVACPDDYMALPHKTRAILRWFLDSTYDFIFLCDTDTFVMPDRLLRSGFEQYDLVGFFNGAIGVPEATFGDAGHWHPGSRYWAWISGGNGYWLSRRAAQLVADAPDTGDWAEDRVIGQVLGPYFQQGDLKAWHHPDYGLVAQNNQWLTHITSHYCAHGLRRKFDVSWMHLRYAYNVLGRNV